MHSALVLILTAFLGLVAAVPAPKTSPLDKRWGGNGNRFWQHRDLSSSFLDFTRRQADALESKCNIGNAQLPAGKQYLFFLRETVDNMLTSATANPALPPPAHGTYLAHVAVGRGIQNYTCDLSNTTAVPVPIGAIAVLFNVSCTASDSPTLLQQLPGIALNLPIPATADQSSPAYNDLSGHHYFSDMTTAVFNLDTALHEYGVGSFKKVNASAAPADAMVGPHGQGNGAVAWLKLDAKNGTSQALQNVYRVNTAGGQPPKTCAGQSALFEIQYSAEYWFYSK